MTIICALLLLSARPGLAGDWWKTPAQRTSPPERAQDPWPVIDPALFPRFEHACLDAEPPAPPQSPACRSFFSGAVAQVMTQNGWGSGFFLKGYPNLLVTNWHVVEDVAPGYPAIVRWLFHPGRAGARPLTLIGTVVAKNFYRDLALLKVDNPYRVALPMGGEDLGAPDRVAVVGYPGDISLRTTLLVTEGHAAAPRISVNTESWWPRPMLTHNAPSHGGNSGGPVLDWASKRVIGVTESVLGQYNDAVPLVSLKYFLKRYRSGLPTAAGWLSLRYGPERKLTIAGKPRWGIRIDGALDAAGRPLESASHPPRGYKDFPPSLADRGKWIVAVDHLSLGDLLRLGAPSSGGGGTGAGPIDTRAKAIALFVMQLYQGDRVLLSLYDPTTGLVIEKPVGLRARPDTAPWIYPTSP
ncbi:MAG: trypsin-like peptidase domain-containing protein [Elusimicrobia bacterium]|nr:trypsin-like peptidase domain-containing protein [Elusimicrobiota bacterium]MDE2425860.1 trypsin-like peptidase domain-containing protein [Elusimicrobiota bacterium]